MYLILAIVLLVAGIVTLVRSRPPQPNAGMMRVLGAIITVLALVLLVMQLMLRAG